MAEFKNWSIWEVASLKIKLLVGGVGGRFFQLGAWHFGFCEADNISDVSKWCNNQNNDSAVTRNKNDGHCAVPVSRTGTAVPPATMSSLTAWLNTKVGNKEKNEKNTFVAMDAGPSLRIKV